MGSHRHKLTISLLVACFGITAMGHSTTTFADELDDAFGGFDEGSTPATQKIEPASDTTESRYGELTGSVALSSSYNLHDHYSSNGTYWGGLSKLRTRLNLEYNNALNEQWQMQISGYSFYDAVYYLRDRDNYANDVLNNYERESEFQEVWVRGKLRNNLDLKIGRQIVVWGRADSFRVLDILNPVDNREPGLVDIEDLRLPVGMIKTDYFFAEHWQSSFIILPEVRFSKNPARGSDFEIIAPRYKENEPDDVSDSSYAAAVTGIFSGWDISLHAARYWRDTPYLEPVFNPAGNVLDPRYPLEKSTLEHSRLTMIGAGGNYTTGAWLYKGELAFIDGIDYTIGTNQGPPFGFVPTTSTEKNRIDALIGIEYFGIANSSLSVEIAHQYIPDYESGMTIAHEEKNTTGISFRATHSMLNDRLDLTAVIFGTFGESGGGERFDAEYDIRDALVLKAGVIFYDKGDNIPFDTYYDNDRVFAELKYSF